MILLLVLYIRTGPIAETGVWCSLNEGIDPVEWASLCRYIGNMGAREFNKALLRIVQSSILTISSL